MNEWLHGTPWPSHNTVYYSIVTLQVSPPAIILCPQTAYIWPWPAGQVLARGCCSSSHPAVSAPLPAVPCLPLLLPASNGYNHLQSSDPTFVDYY